MVGKKFGAYEITGEIGRGGMGIVYSAIQTSLGREVALKILPPQLAMEKEFVTRFFREARSAANLNHPRIVTVHDVGEHDNIYYLAMEYIRGQSLEEIMEKHGPLPLDTAENYIAQIGDALGYAHQKGVIHRDVKAANILIDENGRSVITDFGIAKAAYDQKLTKTGTTIGSPEYMAPEQITGKPADARADLYSLGIVFYQLLSGKVPFSGDTSVSIAYKHVNDPVPPLKNIRLDVPDYMDNIIQKLLKKDPQDRYQSAEELVQDLNEKADPFPAVQANVPQPAFFEAPAAAAIPLEPSPRPAQAGSRKKLLLVLGTMLGVLAVVIIISVFQISKTDSRPPSSSGGSSGAAVIMPPDLSTPENTANYLLSAIYRKDADAIKIGMTSEKRLEFEKLEAEAPEKIKQGFDSLQSMSSGVQRISEIRKDPTSGLIYARILERSEGVFCTVMVEKNRKFLAEAWNIINKDYYTLLPEWDKNQGASLPPDPSRRTTPRLNDPGSVADFVLAAIKKVDLDALETVMTGELIAEWNLDSAEGRKNLKEDVLSVLEMLQGTHRVSELRRDKQGRILALMFTDEDEVLLIALIKKNNQYFFSGWDDMQKDDYSALPLFR